MELYNNLQKASIHIDRLKAKMRTVPLCQRMTRIDISIQQNDNQQVKYLPRKKKKLPQIFQYSVTNRNSPYQSEMSEVLLNSQIFPTPCEFRRKIFIQPETIQKAPNKYIKLLPPIKLNDIHDNLKGWSVETIASTR
ncbi:hypothetical protein pb186bvf_010374 [Paramecium bursaria]